jgi:hypothetical protein
LIEHFAWNGLQLQSSDLRFQSSWDYRHEPLPIKKNLYGKDTIKRHRQGEAFAMSVINDACIDGKYIKIKVPKNQKENENSTKDN